MALIPIPNATLHRSSLANIARIIKLNLVDIAIGVPQVEVDKLNTLAPYNNSVITFFTHTAALLTAVGATTIPYKGNVQYYRNDINAALKVIRTNMWTKAGEPITPDDPNFDILAMASVAKVKSKKTSKRTTKKKVSKKKSK